MEGITNARTRAYLEAIAPARDARLSAMREEALAAGVPIIKFEMESFLESLLLLKQPARILEIGTAVGYSASLMDLACSGRTSITTLELSPAMCIKAEANFRRMGMEDRVALIQGDALETVKDLEGPFGFIFLDGAKGQYLKILDSLLALLETGGVLVSDNVLQDGTIAKSRFAVPRRQRTIHQNMRQYLWQLNHTEGLATTILPVADGVAVSIKTQETVSG